MAQKAKKLRAFLPDGDSQSLVDKFAQAHTKMGDDYRKGFEASKAAGFDPAVGDTGVKGMDRPPVKLLDEALNKIAVDSTAVSAQAAADGKRATIISLVVMLLMCVFGIVVGGLLSRGIVKQLGGEPETAAELARLVAQGDLSVQPDVKQGDTTSVMARLAEMQASLASVGKRPVTAS